MKTINEVIAKNPLFLGMKPEHLALLVEGARSAELNAGEMLFREGEPASRFYVIESGKVVLEAHEPADGTLPVQTVGAGEVVGWSWMFPPFVWHLQARAVEPTRLVVLDGAHLLVAAERDREFGYDLMKRVVQVIIHRLQATRRQLLALQVESALDG